MINDHIVRITGGFSVSSSLDIDTEYTLTLPVDIFSTEDRSNQDGTFNRHYKGKVNGEAVMIKGDTIIRSKDKLRWSQKLRRAIYSEDHDYDKFMGWLFATKLDYLFDEYLREV